MLGLPNDSRNTLHLPQKRVVPGDDVQRRRSYRRDDPFGREVRVVLLHVSKRVRGDDDGFLEIGDGAHRGDV